MPTTTATRHNLTLPWVEHATQGFVFCDDMREAVSLAITAGLHLIFSGPGGHAKSEFLQAVFGAISGHETFIKSLGQGTSTEELFGGLDLDALNRAEGAALRYRPEWSFLAHPYAILEEAFDSPSRVLTFLKDTLTAKELRNGHQRYPMATRVIAIPTNHSPQEIAEAGPEVEALIQRFPIQLHVSWDHYHREDFDALFATVLGREGNSQPVTTLVEVEALQQQAEAVTVGVGARKMLSHILVELIADEVPISPRTAMMALQLARAAAAINGRAEVAMADINAVAYLPGALRLRTRISQLIADSTETIMAEEHLDQAQQRIDVLAARLRGTTNADELRAIASEATYIAGTVAGLRVTPDQLERRHTLRDSASSLADDATNVRDNAETAGIASTLHDLQGRLGQTDSVAECEQFRDDVRALVTRATGARPSHLTSEARTLLQLAEEQLGEARLAAGVDAAAARLGEIDNRLGAISRRLSRPISPEARADLIREVNEFHQELGAMMVHAGLQATLDAVRSKVMVIRMGNRN